MKSIKNTFLTIMAITVLLFIQCDKEDIPFYDDITPRVEFEDVWMESMIDVDGDGYFSGGALYYDLKSNKILGVTCYVWLGYKRSVYPDSTIYHGLCTSTDKNADSENENIWYLPLGECCKNLPRDFYHLMIVVRLSTDDTILDKESEDVDLHYIPIEPPGEDTLSNILVSEQ